MRHRHFLAAPFAVLLVVTVIGGQINRVDAQGVVIDTSTQQPVPGVSIAYGANRGAVSDDQGRYLITNLPRDARLKTNKPGYQPASAAATDTQINLVPGSLSLQVNEEGTTDTRVSGTEVRQGEKLLTKCTADPCGQLVIPVLDIVGQKALVCAPNHDSEEIDLKGVTLVMTLKKHDGAGCPPLPSTRPSPVPSPSSTPGGSPSPTPTATP